MELILVEDVAGLGYKNDIVSVKKGYGRNYLIPQGKAVIASERQAVQRGKSAVGEDSSGQIWQPVSGSF